MRYLVTASLLLAANLGSAAGPEIPAQLESTQIPNYVRAEPHLAVGGQPAEALLGQLKQLGFQTVINLRVLGEKGFVDERPLIEAQKLNYVSIPVTAETLSVADVTALAAALRDSGNTLLHCASGNRVGGLWMALEVSRGKSLDEAEAAGRKRGLKSPVMLDAARRVSAEIQAAKTGAKK